jgi:hypothetical protein
MAQAAGVPTVRKGAKDGARIIRAPLSNRVALAVRSRRPKRDERNTLMNSLRYVGKDVHRDTISVAVLDETGRLMMLATRGRRFWILFMGCEARYK